MMCTRKGTAPRSPPRLSTEPCPSHTQTSTARPQRRSAGLGFIGSVAAPVGPRGGAAVGSGGLGATGPVTRTVLKSFCNHLKHRN